MFNQLTLLLLAAPLLVYATAFAPGNAVEVANSQSICGCTATVTEYRAIEARQESTCPPQVTSYVTITAAEPVVTIVGGDPSSIASSFSYASGIDSIEYQNSIEDRPTGNAPETTPIFFTHTANGPAAVGTDDPNDGTILYHYAGTTTAPVAVTTVSFPPADGPPRPVGTGGTSRHPWVTTITTYLSTVTVGPNVASVTTPPSNLSITSRNLQKRQTCSMIFAVISGQWASWCNNWDGSTVVSFSTYNTTTLITSVPGLDGPIPASVYSSSSSASSASLASSESVTIQTTPAEAPTSTSIPTSLPEPPTSSEGPTSTSTPTSLPGPPTPNFESSTTEVTSSSSQTGPIITSIVITTSVVVTFPVTTITQTFPDSGSSSTSAAPAATSSCGQIGQFVITYDDLPAFSTSNPNTTDAPPIFEPYDHFYWSSGYSYGPPPNTPYPPAPATDDNKRLAIYDPADALPVQGATNEGRDLPGSFGAGPRFWNSTFWFDAKSVFAGCNNTGSVAPCDITVTGYRWYPNTDPNASKAEGHEEVAFPQQFSLSSCTSSTCDLTQIAFDEAKFSGLSSINFVAKVEGVVTGFYLDSFVGSWTNSTCEAGLERASSRK